MHRCRTSLPASGAFWALWVLAAWLVSGGRVEAKPVQIEPKTTHSALTQTTDETFGYQVFPNKPLKMDLVGPGQLTLTVRLNHATKRSVFKGQLTIRRGSRAIKRSRLKLHRSRVGAYKEDESVHPSLPKVFKVKVPSGLHTYTVSLRAARGISMTLQIAYDSDADQSAARGQDDALALVPLVAPGSEEGDIPLVPLVAPETKPEKKPPKPASEPKKPTAVAVAGTEKRPEKTEVKKEPPIEKPLVAATTEPKKKPVFEKVKVIPPPPRKKPETAGVTSSREAPESTTVTDAAPGKVSHVISLGIKGGQISPLYASEAGKAGGTTYTFSLDIRYILPVFDERLTLGVEAGFYNYARNETNTGRSFDTKVIPISLNLFYRLPIATLFQLFFGAGGDLFVAMSKLTPDGTEETTFAFGGHVSLGAEAELGPGFLLLEVRAGASMGDAGVLGDNVNIAGISTLLGYRFVF